MSEGQRSLPENKKIMETVTIEIIKAKYAAKLAFYTEKGWKINQGQILEKVLAEVGCIELGGGWLSPEDSAAWEAYQKSKPHEFDALIGVTKTALPRPVVTRVNFVELFNQIAL